MIIQLTTLTKPLKIILQEAEKLSDHKGSGDNINNGNIASIHQSNIVDLQQGTLETNFTELDIPQKSEYVHSIEF